MGYILQQGCTIRCPHGGQARVIPGNRRVRLGGGYTLLPTDAFVISGCPFTVGLKPQPCVTIEWQVPAGRARTGGIGFLLESSVGLCKSAEQVIQGKALVTGVQRRVKAR